MTVVQDSGLPAGQFGVDVHWSTVIGGAISATALSLLLITFGSGIGLAISSSSPTWRDTSTMSLVVGGAYLIFVALASFGLGGYVCGRMHKRITAAETSKELEFRDGMHGLLSWALAIVIGAILAVASAQTMTRAAAPVASAAAGSVVGESTLAYELDELFRSDRAPRDFDMALTRAEASRILLTSIRKAGVSQDDRDYLANMVSTRAEISPALAQDRVASIIPQAQQALKDAREAAVMTAFMVAVSLLIGAAMAWLAGREGGRERQIGGAPVWRWSLAQRAREHRTVGF
jgi:hypothetical protein